MKLTRAFLLTAIAVAFVAGCDDGDPTGPGAGSNTADFDWRGTVAPGDRIEIKNIAGDLHASYTAGNEVVVHATKTGRNSDPASVTIEVVRHGDGVTICAIYPDVPGQAPNECAPGVQGNISNWDNDVSVHFTVSVPAGVGFVGRAVGGDVVAEGLQSDARAVTVGGDISVTTTGMAEASSTFGSLNITIGRADPDRDLTFKTISGDVTLRVPLNTNAEVQATTGRGTIDSDFQLEGTSHRKVGTLGSGGPMLTLSTVEGDVDLRAGN
ncbi:MAG: DUF4097 family beta strand repeat protein [Gemmatimonadota bacterium]|nr:MAG: DUF4097 family beta strand repeat protein [Gemmatimonadota bacterium]